MPSGGGRQSRGRVEVGGWGGGAGYAWIVVSDGRWRHATIMRQLSGGRGVSGFSGFP